MLCPVLSKSLALEKREPCMSVSPLPQHSPGNGGAPVGVNEVIPALRRLLHNLCLYPVV